LVTWYRSLSEATNPFSFGLVFLVPSLATNNLKSGHLFWALESILAVKQKQKHMA
jgi:hypothetical protein